MATNTEQYQERINRILTYLCRNIGSDFSLDELSKIACFSKFHFLRIFKAVVGETVGEFIRRIRIEKAAYHLIYNPSSPVTRIALDCGFSSSQNFAKAFKSYYNCSPREFRNRSKCQPLCSDSNPGNMMSSLGKEPESTIRYIDIINGAAISLETDTMVASHVSLQEFQDIEVAYIRKTANYTPQIIAAACGELYAWGFPRGLIEKETSVYSVYWDNVAVTPVDKRRFDVCIPVTSSTSLSRPVCRQTLAGGLYAVYQAAIENYDFYFHWNRFLKFWFPSSGFIPDDRPCFEKINNLFGSSTTLDVAICVPIKRI